ncbi:MAG: hypothetical protein AMXMBFR84_19380 [Candidatus Hydrogenedentota bacterium]
MRHMRRLAVIAALVSCAQIDAMAQDQPAPAPEAAPPAAETPAAPVEPAPAPEAAPPPDPAAAAPVPEGPADFASFGVSQLQCIIGGNGATGEHNAGYNGVFHLAVPGKDENLYVPFYAGVNLEHYFDSRPRSEDRKVFFEPRFSPMTFAKVNETTAELYQPETPVYGVESWTRFEVKEPNYIDVTYRCVPKRGIFEGYMGVFWASYINAPLDKSIYFLGDGSLDTPIWAQYCTQKHGHASSVLSKEETAELPYPPEGDTLFNSLSPLRYTEPFYYGRWRDMVLIYIFKPNPYLRFSHSPSGGGKTKDGDDTNPAWDFQMVIPDYEVGKEYTLEMRVVFKPWVDRADVLNEVRSYLGRL